MVKVERSFPAPESLAVEAKKKNGSYSSTDVVERLKEGKWGEDRGCFLDCYGMSVKLCIISVLGIYR